MLESAHPVTAGSPLKISVRDWNAMLRIVRREEQSQTNSPSGGGHSGGEHPAITATILNTEGAAWNAGYVAAVNNATGEFLNPNYRHAAIHPVLEAFTPLLTTDANKLKICILLEPIASGKFGTAVFQGFATCVVNIRDEAHGYATLVDNDASKLQSDVYGPVVIVDRSSTGTGDKTCMVYVDNSINDDREIVRWVKCTSDTSTSSSWPGVLLERAAGSYTVTSTVVRLKLQSGDRFINNGIYLATFSKGEIDISGTDYPVYFANGNQGTPLEVCVDGVTQFDRFDFVAPFRRVSNVDEITGEPLP